MRQSGAGIIVRILGHKLVQNKRLALNYWNISRAIQDFDEMEL